MQYTRAKCTRYGDHMVKANGEPNSYLKLFITQTFWWSLQFELSKFHCTPFLGVGCKSDNPGLYSVWESSTGHDWQNITITVAGF